MKARLVGNACRMMLRARPTNRFKAPTRACTHVFVLLGHACMQFDVLTGRAADDIIQRSMPRGPSPWSAHPPSTWQMKMNICGRQPQPSPLTSGVCVYALAFCVCWSPDVPLVYAARVGTRQPAVSSTSSLPTPPEGAGTSHRMRASRLRKGCHHNSHATWNTCPPFFYISKIGRYLWKPLIASPILPGQ